MVNVISFNVYSQYGVGEYANTAWSFLHSYVQCISNPSTNEILLTVSSKHKQYDVQELPTFTKVSGWHYKIETLLQSAFALRNFTTVLSP